MNEEDKGKIISFLEWKRKKETGEGASSKDHHREQDKRLFHYYLESEDRFFQVASLPDLTPISVQGATIEFPFRTNAQIANFHAKQRDTIAVLAKMRPRQQFNTAEQKKAHENIPFAFAELLGVRSALLTQHEYIHTLDPKEILRYSGASFTLFKALTQKFHPESSLMIFNALRTKQSAEVFDFMKVTARSLLDSMADAYPKADFSPIYKLIASAKMSEGKRGKASSEFAYAVILAGGAIARREAISCYAVKDIKKMTAARDRLFDIENRIYHLSEIVDYFEGIHFDE
ncbi:hypothetical protein HY621_01250 [Candidatus Uhrbacteria bacterium]|nr:hypothetical protein [Candidatus Uhrbacteria bacterium]